MADKHIDNTETQIYGPKLRENLSRAFAGSAPPVKAFIAYLVELQAQADERMAAGMAKARGATSELSTAAKAKSPALDNARQVLRGVHQHLSAKQALGAWKGDIKLFFPGGLGGIGKYASDVASSLATARAALAQDKSVPDGAALRKQLTAVEAKLRKEMDNTHEAAAAARAGLSEQSTERKSWSAVYHGIAKIADGLFSIEQREASLASVVPHLVVNSGKKRKAKADPKPDAKPLAPVA